MPTVDHIDPDVLEFEICSFQSNDCKPLGLQEDNSIVFGRSDLKPEEFVEFCKRVVEYRSK